MTMKLTIKNEDASRTAIVETTDVDPDSQTSKGEAKELKPGDSHEVWIHQGRRVVVSEKA